MSLNIKLQLNVKETHRTTSNLNQFQNDREIKIVQAPSVVETFPNIKQQFEIDVDATRTALISKNILIFVFQFLEKTFSNTMFETVRSI